jgi:hypothetical protein
MGTHKLRILVGLSLLGNVVLGTLVALRPDGSTGPIATIPTTPPQTKHREKLAEESSSSSEGTGPKLSICRENLTAARRDLAAAQRTLRANMNSAELYELGAPNQELTLDVRNTLANVRGQLPPEAGLSIDCKDNTCALTILVLANDPRLNEWLSTARAILDKRFGVAKLSTRASRPVASVGDSRTFREVPVFISLKSVGTSERPNVGQ